MATRLFIYGTLKRGHRAHALIADQTFLGEATTTPHYCLLDLGWYPGLAFSETRGQSIHGEIWEITDACLRELDDYEGNEYTRREIELLQTFTVQAYVLREPDWSKPDAGTCWTAS